jgi:hypothetical protein
VNHIPAEFALGPCFCCGLPFSYHPGLVARVWIDPETGQAPDTGGDPDRARPEAVCPRCARAANPFRLANGLAPIDERDSLETARRGAVRPLL